MDQEHSTNNMESITRTEAESRGDGSYFESYEDLEVHRLMLKDVPRTEAYRQAILGNNKDLFRGKTVMDIGAGTGILSLFCAQAGAAKVYAVEAAAGLVNLIREVVAKNGFSHLIEVIHGKAEEIDLPGGPHQVDIIVSEWMGFYLLHESMLESVLKAREKHLKPDTGLMFPSRAKIYAAGTSLNAFYGEHEPDLWRDLYGLDLSPVGHALLDAKRSKPEITIVPPGDLLTEPVLLAEFDLAWLDVEEIQRVHSRSFASVTEAVDEPCPFRGVCLWFDCTFDPSGVCLSTSPQAPPTHWMQTVILLPGSVTVEEGDIIGWEVTLRRKSDGQRGYVIELNLLDGEEEEHPVPCGCGQARCVVIAAMVAKEEADFQ